MGGTMASRRAGQEKVHMGHGMQSQGTRRVQG